MWLFTALIFFLLYFLLLILFLPYAFDAQLDKTDETLSCQFNFSILYRFLIMKYHIKNPKVRTIGLWFRSYELWSIDDQKVFTFIKKMCPKNTYQDIRKTTISDIIDAGLFFCNHPYEWIHIIRSFHLDIQGKLSIGFEDPFYTGTFVGFIQSLIDAIPNHQFMLTPDFTRSCCLTQSKVRGYFWLPQLLYLCICVVIKKRAY